MTPTHDELLKLANAEFNGSKYMQVVRSEKSRQPYLDGFMNAAELLCAHQAQAEPPIGWVTEDYLTDKSATTYDSTIAARWRTKGWPVKPIYTAPPSSDQTWNEAIGAANAECQAEFEHVKEIGLAEAMAACMTIQDRLRKLVRPSQAQEPSVWTVMHNGKSVTAESLVKAMAVARTLRTDEEEQIAAENLMRAVSEELAQPVSGAADEHSAAVEIVHAAAGRTLSKQDFDMCMRIAHSALSRAQQAPAVGNMLRRVLEWRNPNGTIEESYLPPWLAKGARALLSQPTAAPVSEPGAVKWAPGEREAAIWEHYVGPIEKDCPERNTCAGKKTCYCKAKDAAPVSEQTAQPVERQELSDSEILKSFHMEHLPYVEGRQFVKTVRGYFGAKDRGQA